MPESRAAAHQPSHVVGAPAKRLRYFVPLPIALVRDPNVSANAVRLAGILMSYDGPEGCFPRVATLMDDMNASKRTVLRTLEELERYGFFTRQPRGRRTQFVLHVVYERPFRADDIQRTGALAIENDLPAGPLPRRDLDRTGAARGTSRGVRPGTKGATGDTVMGATGGAKVVRKGATARRYDLESCSNKIQQQQDAAAAEIRRLLETDGFPTDEAARWAADLADLAPQAVLEAARVMRGRSSYRRREIARPALYLRAVIAGDRVAAYERIEAAITRECIDAVEEPAALAASLLADVSDAERTAIEQRALTIAPAGSSSPGWHAAVVMAAGMLRREGAVPA